MSEAAVTNFVLPPALIGRADLARLVRELEAVDNDLEAQRVRKSAENGGYRMPTMSQALSDFLTLNQVDVADDQARQRVRERLRAMKDKSPVIHMTFAVDADPDFLQQLVAYLRTEIHPETLLSVGLQPAIIGGTYMRTPNHVHDFTVKALLAGKRDIIVRELEGLS